MRQRIVYAIKETQRDLSSNLFGRNTEISSIFLSLAAFSCFVGGALFSLKEIGGGGYILNFIAGCFSSAIYLALGGGSILLFASISAFGLYMKYGTRGHSSAMTLADKAVIALAGGLTLAVAALSILAVNAIPIVGKQVTFMMRDQG